MKDRHAKWSQWANPDQAHDNMIELSLKQRLWSLEVGTKEKLTT